MSPTFHQCLLEKSSMNHQCNIDVSEYRALWSLIIRNVCNEFINVSSILHRCCIDVSLKNKQVVSMRSMIHHFFQCLPIRVLVYYHFSREFRPSLTKLLAMNERGVRSACVIGLSFFKIFFGHIDDRCGHEHLTSFFAKFMTVNKKSEVIKLLIILLKRPREIPVGTLSRRYLCTLNFRISKFWEIWINQRGKHLTEISYPSLQKFVMCPGIGFTYS